MSIKIYAAGAVAGAKDQNWKEQLKDILKRLEIEYNSKHTEQAVPYSEVQIIDPLYRSVLNKLLDVEGDAEEIVKGNIADVMTADVIVLYCDAPSAGGTLEAVFGKLLGADVFLVVPPWAKSSLSVWLMHLFPMRGTWEDFENWLRDYI